MENEKIFVVVPVYKVEPYLERCIDSILNQTYTNYELVLVDDGSPDNCPEICDRYAAEYDNITVIHQENGGVSVARNTGVEYALAHGDPDKNWISFVDSDDFVHPCYLEYLYHAVKETGVQICCCHFVRTYSSTIHPNNSLPLKYDFLTPEKYWCRNRENPAVVWGKLYCLCCFHGITFPVGKIYEDNYTTYKVLFGCPKIVVISEKLYNWYINPQSITMSSRTPAYIDSIKSLEEQIIFFENNGYHKALKKAAADYYKCALNNFLCIKELSPKYDQLINKATAKKNQALKTCLKTAGPSATLYSWFVPTVMSYKKLRKIVKKIYFRIRNRLK